MPETPNPAPLNVVQMMTALREAMRPAVAAYVQWATRVMESMRPLAEWAEQHSEEFARWQLERDQERSCHCLCGMHREQSDAVCAGTAVPGLSVRFDSPTVGTQHVPMCRACHDARGHDARQLAAT